MFEFKEKTNRNEIKNAFRANGHVRSTSNSSLNTKQFYPQQIMGNQAILRFAASCPLKMPASSMCPLGGACHTCPVSIQKKLKISKPSDKYEQEADRVAETVLRMHDPITQRIKQNTNNTPNNIQKKCSKCEEGQIKIQPENEKENKRSIQTKRVNYESLNMIPGISTNINSILTGGQPLPKSVRLYFEPRFGVDFSQVKIHNNQLANETAKQINAHAYTVGRDIVFGNGQYAPESEHGKKLLAHELTHVVQQSGGKTSMRMGNSYINTAFPMIQRLGANPGCTIAERDIIRQAIFNARGWLNKAIRQMETRPLSQAVIRSLRRNFGPTYGVPADADLILGRLRRVYREISTISISCAGTEDATCAANHCGFAIAGGHAATVCRNVTLTAGTAWQFQAGCVLHESFHSAFSNFTVDEYSGWHGFSGSTPTYPGAGTDPLLNADSYTTLVMDLS